MDTKRLYYALAVGAAGSLVYFLLFHPAPADCGCEGRQNKLRQFLGLDD